MRQLFCVCSATFLTTTSTFQTVACHREKRGEILPRHSVINLTEYSDNLRRKNFRRHWRIDK
jgi:hypothetical protein